MAKKSKKINYSAFQELFNVTGSITITKVGLGS